MRALTSVARKELVSLGRERLPLVMLVVFVVMASLSGLIGWLTNTTVSSVWRKTVQAGLTQAPNPFANVSPLYYMRNSVIYLILIGALMAIVVGVTSALRDRKARAVDLVLSRPVGSRSYVLGKVTGIGLWLGAVLAFVAGITWVSVSVITQHALGVGDSARIGGFFLLAWVLLLEFAVLGLLAGVYSARETTALLVPISLWSVVVFVLPQIGTAATPVSLLNPVPAVAVAGGGFDTLNSVLGPVSVTEQFKTASGLITANPDATGSLATSLLAVGLPLVVGLVVLASTRRERLREALRD